MELKNKRTKRCVGEPVLNFISGETNTPSAKRLTKGICSVQALWLLAKMSKTIKMGGSE